MQVSTLLLRTDNGQIPDIKQSHLPVDDAAALIHHICLGLKGNFFWRYEAILLGVPCNSIKVAGSRQHSALTCGTVGVWEWGRGAEVETF